MKNGNREPRAADGGAACVRRWILTGTGIAICVLLAPILAVNLTLLIRGYVSQEVPCVGGAVPLVVLTDSMSPEIESGDLIVCQTADPSSVQVGDTISFFDPASAKSSIVTHRVVEVTEQDGEIAWRTKGDANNVEDAALVPASKLVARYSGIRLPGVGHAAIFMQSTAGLAICVVVPLVLLVVWGAMRLRASEKEHESETERLKAELDELRRTGALSPEASL